MGAWIMAERHSSEAQHARREEYGMSWISCEEEHDHQGAGGEECAQGQLVAAGDGPTNRAEGGQAAAGGAESETGFPARQKDTQNDEDTGDPAGESAQENGEQGA